jgi:hypothetical protein
MRLLAHPLRIINNQKTQFLLELATITLLATLFICLSAPTPTNSTPDGLDTAPLMTALFDPQYRQIGLEHERLAGVLLPVKIGMEKYGHIPTWNPYLGGGEPIINNAFSYLFNPFHSLPVLLTDSFAQGTKLATYVAILIAGYNMWALAYVLGIGAVGRIAAGALYLMNGSIAGKFYAGHFQLALSLAWPPLVLAALWWTLRSKNRFAPVAFGIAFALLFFAGNIYYVLHTLLCAGLLILVNLIERRERVSSGAIRERFIFRRDRLKRVAIAMAFAFGLAAAQFFPVWLVRDYVDHDIQHFKADGSIEGQYDMPQALANFLYPWSETSFLNWMNYEVNIAVDYSYIGPGVLAFIGAAGLIVLARRRLSTGIDAPRRLILAAVILIAVMTIWGAGQTSILQFLYTNISLLKEFRFLGRAHAIAALWWIVLGGMAIDILWRAAREWFRRSAMFEAVDRARLIRAAFVGLAIWVYWLVYSASNTSTRLGLVLNNVRWLNMFDERRFTSFEGAMAGLWVLILTTVALDTGLMLFGYMVKIGRKRVQENEPVNWRAVITRLARIGILVGVFLALNDIMRVNGKLYKVEKQTTSLAAVYPDVRKADNDPFPSITLPHSPIAFEVYEAELRNWGLNEGWSPNSTNGLLSWEVGTLLNLPRWVIVSNTFGGASRDFAQRLADENGFHLIGCYALDATAGEPCDMESGMRAALYKRDDLLPYAFVVPAEALLNLPSKLRVSNVYPAQVIAHRQDSITIQAKKPPVDGDYYLVVEEYNFPGWKATADGIPLETYAAQTYRDSLTGDHGFIAVLMPEGATNYSFWFEPPGFLLGVVVSVGTVIIIIGYLWTGRKKAADF